jgi:hypothetical protein
MQLYVRDVVFTPEKSLACVLSFVMLGPQWEEVAESIKGYGGKVLACCNNVSLLVHPDLTTQNPASLLPLLTLQ